MNITCTGCQGILVVGEEMRGKSVRCAKCNIITRVVDNPPESPASATGIKDVVLVGAAPPGIDAAEDEPTRPVRRRDYDDEDDDDDDFNPRRRRRTIDRRQGASGQNAMIGLIIILIAIFFVLPFIIAGAIGFAFDVADQQAEQAVVEQIRIAEQFEAKMNPGNGWEENFDPGQAPVAPEPEQVQPPARAQNKKFIEDNLALNKQEGQLAPDSPLWADVARRTAQPRLRKSPRLNGHRGLVDFQELAPDGGILVGFFVAPPDQNVIDYLQPIYLTAKGEKVGRAYGAPKEQPTCVKAKAGYAVGAMTVRSGDLLDGFSITFMKVVGDRLDPEDVYESPYFGGHGGDLLRLDSEGRFLVGIHGRRIANQDWTPPGRLTTLGLISLP